MSNELILTVLVSLMCLYAYMRLRRERERNLQLVNRVHSYRLLVEEHRMQLRDVVHQVLNKGVGHPNIVLANHILNSIFNASERGEIVDLKYLPSTWRDAVMLEWILEGHEYPERVKDEVMDFIGRGDVQKAASLAIRLFEEYIEGHVEAPSYLGVTA